MDCLFCDICAGKIPATILFRDEVVAAFADIRPQAKHHIVIVPLKHISTLNDLTSSDNELIGHMIQSAVKIAKELKISEEGYRLVLNCNENGGQTIFHVHLHLLGGRSMLWPPG